MLNYGGLKRHILLALGGQPSIVSGVTQSERIAEIVNQAGQYLFTKAWRFRERTSRPIGVIANQSWSALPGDVEDIVSLTCRGGLGWAIQLTSPDHLEMLRTTSINVTNGNAFYAALSRPWAQSNDTTALVAGTTMPAVRIEFYPTPPSTVSDAVMVRYRSGWVEVSGATATLTADTYQIPVPAYCDSLLIAYSRAFALAYEDEGLTNRLLEVDNGPLYSAAATKDGISQRDYGRLLPRVGSAGGHQRYLGGTVSDPD